MINSSNILNNRRVVANTPPTGEFPAPYKIAIIGECPGVDDEQLGRPFVGGSGRFLDALLKDASIERKACFLGNVCQVRGKGSLATEFITDIPAWKSKKHFNAWAGQELKDGMAQLKSDLEAYRPNICLLLGDIPLRLAGISEGVADYRGYLFFCNDEYSPFHGYKCLATYAPLQLFKQYEYTAITRFDIKRARCHATTRELTVPVRNFDIDLSCEQIVSRLRDIRENTTPFSYDIEGGVYGISCCSIATGPELAFIVPFMNMDKTPIWSLSDECLITRELALTLESPAPKILQSGLYDRFVVAYYMKTMMAAQAEDSMLKHWELYSEMEKSLGFMGSLYTDEPYWKHRRKAATKKEFFTYCCTDSAVTYEIVNKIAPKLKGSSEAHYKFNISMLNPILYIELNGMRINCDKRDDRIEQLTNEATVEQQKLETMAGKELNVRSPKQMKEFLYEDLGLREIRAKTKDPEKEEGNLSADFATLLTHSRETQMPVLRQVITVRRFRKRISDLASLTPDRDGRIRSTINVVGTETGRLSNKKSPTGKGANLQTVTKDDRDLFEADEGEWFFQCDLSGADGWTVAAHCARLGDSTMLDDLLYGLKIPKLIALIVKHGPHKINTSSRQELKELSATVSKDDPIYFCCKQVQHGTNYLMGPKTVALRIFLESDGEQWVTVETAKTYQDCYLSRYKGVRRWHQDTEMFIKKHGYVNAASGQRRLLFGRKDDHKTLGEALAHEPQANTTYATNLALLNLWRAAENRTSNAGLIIRPCHQVHDALCGGLPQCKTSWAITQIKSYFNNTLVIAGIPLKIPFEGGYGADWRDHPHSI